MASDRPALRPEVAWATAVGWQEAGPLDWVATGGEVPWAEGGDLGPFQAPPHRSLLPATTADALGAPGVAAPTAHDGLELLLAGASWLVRARALLYGPWSPVPAALAVFAEAWGVGPEIHGGDPGLLRLLAWMLPRWFPERGDATGAATLLEALALVAPTDTPLGARVREAASTLLRAEREAARVPRTEILAAWSERWWDARRAGASPDHRIVSGMTLFQPRSGAGFGVRAGDLLLPLQRSGEIPIQVARLLPPWTMPRRFLDQTVEARSPMERDPNVRAVFQPREGSLLDLESLEAITTVSQDLWWAVEALVADPASGSAATGLSLDGLLLEGIPSTGGPPGALEPRVLQQDGQSVFSVGAGRALMRYQDRAVSASLASTTAVPLPRDFVAGGAATFALTLELDVLPAEGGTFARDQLRPRLRVQPTAEVDRGQQLVLAQSIPNIRRWETDIAAIWNPADARTQRLVRQLGELGNQVWRASPAGLVWDQALLGRDWLRYQCAAAAAMQAAGLELESRPMATSARVRLLESLYRRLVVSVPEVAEGVRLLFGPSLGDGPYARSLERMGASASAPAERS